MFMLVRLLHVARLRKFQLLAAHLNIENTIAVRNTQVNGCMKSRSTSPCTLSPRLRLSYHPKLPEFRNVRVDPLKIRRRQCPHAPLDALNPLSRRNYLFALFG
jgi:hypothetical protein